MSEKTILVHITHIGYAKTLDINGKPMDTQVLEPHRFVKSGPIEETMYFDLWLENEAGQISVKYCEETESFEVGSSFKNLTILGIVPSISITNIGRVMVDPLT